MRHRFEIVHWMSFSTIWLIMPNSWRLYLWDWWNWHFSRRLERQHRENLRYCNMFDRVDRPIAWILVLQQFYWSHPEPSGTRFYWLCYSSLWFSYRGGLFIRLAMISLFLYVILGCSKDCCSNRLLARFWILLMTPGILLILSPSTMNSLQLLLSRIGL